MKKILFISNGEGRGHLTQALSFKKMIENSEYELIGCILGTTEGKIIPSYFKEKIAVPVYELETPQFIKNDNKSISLSKTFFKNILSLNKFTKSLKTINDIIEKDKPDLIINFYEVLTGLWKFKYRNDIPVISIAHQYLINHSSFDFPDNNYFQQFILKMFNKITSYKSKEKWALSFYDTCDEKDIKIIPPLIREEISALKIVTEDFILVYLCNSGYLENIKTIALKSDQIFKVFMNTDKVYELLPNLTVYPLSDTDFLNEMSRCKAIMMSSGFESVCEAKFLNKPCLLVPIENHYEQLCNAFDAEKSEAGKYSETFDIMKLLVYIEEYKQNDVFKDWVKSSKEKLIYRLNRGFNETIHKN
jgi:uncharacterized protein (TIGR00661 family)